MGRPREHGDATRAALLAAAERLIDEHGPDAASVRAVADEVGTTTRAFYCVFGSKDGLLEALATRLFEQLGEAMDTVPVTDDPVEDVVAFAVDGFRRTALEHPSLYSLVFLRVVPDLELGPDFREVAYGALARLEARVDRAIRANGGGRRSSQEAALAVHALTEGLASMEVRGQMLEPAIAERVWREAVRSLVEGLAATEPLALSGR